MGGTLIFAAGHMSKCRHLPHPSPAGAGSWPGPAPPWRRGDASPAPRLRHVQRPAAEELVVRRVRDQHLGAWEGRAEHFENGLLVGTVGRARVDRKMLQISSSRGDRRLKGKSRGKSTMTCLSPCFKKHRPGRSHCKDAVATSIPKHQKVFSRIEVLLSLG